MNIKDTGKELQKATSKMMESIFIGRHQKLQDQINTGVYRPKFPLSEVIKENRVIQVNGKEREG